jgi:peptidoglycan-associated lipoprotein
MVKKWLSIIILLLCVGLLISGCPKKTVVREEPSVRKAEVLAAEREKAARLEAEQKEREAKEREAARIREEEARIREEEARRAEEAKKAQAPKEFEKSLVSEKTPGIAGEVFESNLLKDIHFDFDKYDIRPGDAGVLKENAALFIKHPNVKFQIEGHCDERGTVEYNLALGERRANTTKKYLISLGISATRISTISYGKERPLDPGHNEEAWAKNRRAHIVVLSK